MSTYRSPYRVHLEPRRSAAWIGWALVASVLAAGAFYALAFGVPDALLAWLPGASTRHAAVTPHEPVLSGTPATPAPADEAVAPAPAVQWPMPAAEPDRPADPPLPPLERSDPAVARALATMPHAAGLGRFFNLQDHVPRLVTTVDNLPRPIVPRQMSAVQATAGRIDVQRGDAGRIVIDPRNFQRYEPFVRYVESLDAASLTRLYVRFYPLLEQQYQQQGAQGRFHDRVITAIDDMLAAPVLQQPAELVQPRVLYRYADPDLEGLSAGRKVMMRIGPANARRLAVVLRRWRASLTGDARSLRQEPGGATAAAATVTPVGAAADTGATGSAAPGNRLPPLRLPADGGR